MHDVYKCSAHDFVHTTYKSISGLKGDHEYLGLSCSWLTDQNLDEEFKQFCFK